MSHKCNYSLKLLNLAKDFFFKVGLSEKSLIVSKCHTNQNFILKSIFLAIDYFFTVALSDKSLVVPKCHTNKIFL